MEKIFALNKTFNIFDNVSPKVYSIILKIEELINTINNWRIRAYNRKQLARLSDAMIKDIGLTKFDIQKEINKPFWRN